MTLSLAWRNIWRHRWRSLVTAGAVSLVVLLSLTFFGMGGASRNSFYQRITENSGHVQIRQPGWRDARGLRDSLIRDASTVSRKLAALAESRLEQPIVVGVLDVPALLSGAVRSRAVLIHGQDWPQAIRDRRLEGASLEGRFLEGPGEIVLGASLARALDVALGDEVFAYSPESEGFGAAAYSVVGLVDVADPNQEIVTAWTTLEEAQLLAAPDAVTHFEIHAPSLVTIDDDALAVALADEIGAELPALEALDWRELEPATVQLLETIDPMLYSVSALFFVLAGLLVLNTVYLSVMERVRELGVIQALGAGGSRIVALIATESVLLCSVGALVGAGLGLAAVSSMADGFTVPSLAEYWASFGLDPVLYVTVTPAQVVFAILFAVITALLAALWPAVLAARLEPVDAMRFQA
ncbi:MAG TPA: FtsX-like permease family protein [Trueperaceae bacterium]